MSAFNGDFENQDGEHSTTKLDAKAGAETQNRCQFLDCGEPMEQPGLCKKHEQLAIKFNTPTVDMLHFTYLHHSGASFHVSVKHGNYLVIRGEVIAIQSDEKLHAYIQKAGLSFPTGWQAHLELCTRCGMPLDPIDDLCIITCRRTAWSKFCSPFVSTVRMLTQVARRWKLSGGMERAGK